MNVDCLPLVPTFLSRSRLDATGRAEALEHSARRLLGERQGLRQSIQATTQLLAGLRTAFDPLSPREMLEAGDLLKVDRFYSCFFIDLLSRRPASCI